MSRATILMYHALYDGEDEYLDLDSSERPYAISLADFASHIEALEKENITILDPAVVFSKKTLGDVDRGVIISFDDGHKSFYKYAYPFLKSKGVGAIFFITTDLIDKRSDFCKWNELKLMADDGFLVQAHGKTHQFLPDLSVSSLMDEFSVPKTLLETKTGQPVFSISFPGGRYKKREIKIGKEAGYKMFFTSRIGSLTESMLLSHDVYSRIPVKNGMNVEQIITLVKGGKITHLPHQVIYHAKSLLKLLLGNGFYHVLYQKLSRQ